MNGLFYYKRVHSLSFVMTLIQYFCATLFFAIGLLGQELEDFKKKDGLQANLCSWWGRLCEEAFGKRTANKGLPLCCLSA